MCLVTVRSILIANLVLTACGAGSSGSATPRSVAPALPSGYRWVDAGGLRFAAPASWRAADLPTADGIEYLARVVGEPSSGNPMVVLSCTTAPTGQALDAFVDVMRAEYAATPNKRLLSAEIVHAGRSEFADLVVVVESSPASYRLAKRVLLNEGRACSLDCMADLPQGDTPAAIDACRAALGSLHVP